MPYFTQPQDILALLTPTPATEGATLEFKRQFRDGAAGDQDAYFKIAVTLAALANTDGGALLIGVQQAAGSNPGIAERIYPDLDVVATMQALEAALPFTFGFESTPRGEVISVEGTTPETRGQVVAVNVVPAPRLVSVRSKQDPRSIYYPTRSGKGNDYLRPEEVEMRLLSRYAWTVRGQLVQLARKTPDTGTLVHLQYRSADGGGRLWPTRVIFLGVSPTGARFSFARSESSDSCFVREIPFHWITDHWTHHEPDRRPGYDVGRPAFFVEATLDWHESSAPGGAAGRTVNATPYRR